MHKVQWVSYDNTLRSHSSQRRTIIERLCLCAKSRAISTHYIHEYVSSITEKANDHSYLSVYRSTYTQVCMNSSNQSLSIWRIDQLDAYIVLYRGAAAQRPVDHSERTWWWHYIHPMRQTERKREIIRYYQTQLAYSIHTLKQKEKI